MHWRDGAKIYLRTFGLKAAATSSHPRIAPTDVHPTPRATTTRGTFQPSALAASATNTPRTRPPPFSMATPEYPRDVVGYGQHPPHPRWPGNARVVRGRAQCMPPCFIVPTPPRTPAPHCPHSSGHLHTAVPSLMTTPRCSFASSPGHTAARQQAQRRGPAACRLTNNATLHAALVCRR